MLVTFWIFDTFPFCDYNVTVTDTDLVVDYD